MTAMTSQNYVKKMGLSCPNCSSAHLSPATAMESDAGLAWCEVSCKSCKAVWTDTYGLVGYSGLRLASQKLAAPKQSLKARQGKQKHPSSPPTPVIPTNTRHPHQHPSFLPTPVIPTNTRHSCEGRNPSPD
jgi:hypothetical protein